MNKSQLLISQLNIGEVQLERAEIKKVVGGRTEIAGLEELRKFLDLLGYSPNSIGNIETWKPF